MCFGKYIQNLIITLISSIILLIFLLQIYCEYSSIAIKNTNLHNRMNLKNAITVFKLSKDNQYYFYNAKIKESFEYNALMNIKYLQKLLLKLFELINKKLENKIDLIIYMFCYLILYNIIYFIIVCYFISGSISSGIIKIILQIARFYFNSKRIKKFNKQMNVLSIIKSKIENIYLFRNWNIFNREGYLIIEFLCNYVIIFDILLLIILTYKKNNHRKILNLNNNKEIKNEKINIKKEDDEERLNNIKIKMFERQKNLRKNNNEKDSEFDNDIKNNIDKDENGINEEKIKNKKINEILEDMCIYGNIMKKEIQEEKEKNPEKL